MLPAHAAISVLAGLASMALLPQRYRVSPRRTVAYHTLLAWFIPVLGGIMVMALSLYIRVVSRSYGEHAYQTVRLPVFTAGSQEPAQAYGAGSVHSRLVNTDLPKEVRLQALLTVQSLPGNFSTRLLREVLSDPSDDLRLTAYGMLDKGEKLLNQMIQQGLNQLEQGADAAQTCPIDKQIASCYWELVYQGYAQGELRRFALNEAWRHAQAVVQHCPDDADLWVLVGRIALERRDTEQAEQAFERAQQLSIPVGRVQPYLAELAFLKRNFTAVRSLIREIGVQECGLSTAPLQAFWQKEAAGEPSAQG